MPKIGKFSRSVRPKSGPRAGKGKHQPAQVEQPRFETSRVGEVKNHDQIDDDDSEVEELAFPSGQEQDADDGFEDSDNEEQAAINSYAQLLSALKSRRKSLPDLRPAKKRKPDHGTGNGIIDGARSTASPVLLEIESAPLEEDDIAKLEEVLEEGDSETVEGEQSLDSEDEDILLVDPFESHYQAVQEQELTNSIQLADSGKWQHKQQSTKTELKVTYSSLKADSTTPNRMKNLQDMRLKQKIHDTGYKVLRQADEESRDLASAMFNYLDIASAARDVKNSQMLRDLTCLHALNHIFKTRDQVLKNNAKLAASNNSIEVEGRDQGFTRPKVLFLLPTKQACLRFVDSIIKLGEPDQQENKSRFLETFSNEDTQEWANKPEDFRALFGGNHEEDFRIGLKFTRKTIKFFSGFYNSDIILASPLGLVRTITTGGGSKEKKKGHDSDFLSSVEVVVVDHANALQMQNWQHVDYVFSQMNLLVKDSHGCDFSRVRNWYLDGKAKYLRQTIVLTDYFTPEINALITNHLHNVAGRMKYTPKYSGAMLKIPNSLPFSITQTFLRFDSPRPQADHDARFQHFASTILPQLVRDTQKSKSTVKGTLIFVPTYADFTRLRNHFSISATTETLSFGTLSEYTPVGDTARTRAHFLSGRHSVLLYSERAHHHFRYKIKGVRRLLFYGVPDNPIFWLELVGMLGLNRDLVNGSVKGGAGAGKGMVRALFSKWDVLKLERIVGSERVGGLLADQGLDTFEFV